MSFDGVGIDALAAPLTLGIAAGLLGGKVVGVLVASFLAVHAGLADMPAFASWRHLLGVAFLCGIGFTMSLFIALLAFPGDELLQTESKLGILVGSLASALIGSAVILLGKSPISFRDY
ncbi:Na+/H+ antiporter NhaA [Mesorhizobium sp.]|uniref:Na+/H+ antiporter NhaA n=1 Tax=Mesorhizobium sp. TaxID=1871066 RepID=UPI0025BB421C|nr:Na+/H+ antiporter NhaA [Mesorhizobium sp.]